MIVFVAASICIRLLLNTKIINKQDVKLFDNYAEARRRGRGKPQFFAFASFVTMQKFRENA